MTNTQYENLVDANWGIDAAIDGLGNFLSEGMSVEISSLQDELEGINRRLAVYILSRR